MTDRQVDAQQLLDVDAGPRAVRPAGQLHGDHGRWLHRRSRTRSGHALREQAPVHAGTVHELTGFPTSSYFHGLPYPDRPHFSAFSYAACDAAYRNSEVFASSPRGRSTSPTRQLGVLNSMLSMGGAQHRRYRALVQPSFVPAKAQWWIRNWIEKTVARCSSTGSSTTGRPSSTSTSARRSRC